MQRLSLMRIMKRQRMKYEEFESIYPVTIYHKTIPWIYNSCHFLSFRDRIIEIILIFFIMRVTNESTLNGKERDRVLYCHTDRPGTGRTKQRGIYQEVLCREECLSAD